MQGEMVKWGVPADKIRPVPLYGTYSNKTENNSSIRKSFAARHPKIEYKGRFITSLLINVILVLLVAAMNPCPCGFYPDRNRCRCSSKQIHNYLGKISKPILERFDISAEATPVTYQELRVTKENENLKHMVKKQQKKRRWHNIIGIILIVTGLLFLGIL